MGEGTRTAERITLADQMRPRSGVVAVHLDGEMVLHHPGTGSAQHLDPVGSLIWGRLDGSSTLGAAADDLAAEFGVDRAVVAADVLRLVRELGAHGMLEGVEPASPEPGPHEHHHNHEHHHQTATSNGATADPGEDRPEPRYIAVPPST